MSKRVPSSIILIVYSVVQLFFNQVIIAPYLYKINFKFAFFVLLIVYFLQSLFLILLKNKYEKIRILGNEYYQNVNKISYKIFFCLIIYISLILILFVVYFYFTFINSYFFVNAKYIYIIPLLYVICAFAIYKSFYAIFQFGVMLFLVLCGQFFIFFFSPKTIEISYFLPLNMNFSSNIKIYLMLPTTLFLILFTLPCANLASTPFRKKEIIIISILSFTFNAYYLFIQVKQLGIITSYLDHPFYNVFDALELGFYLEHLYIIPVILCVAGTILFILFLLNNIKLLSQHNSSNIIIIIFGILLFIIIKLLKNIMVFNHILNIFLYILSALFILLFIFCILTFKVERSKNETNI